MRRVELPNNTPEQVERYVTQAIELADKMGLHMQEQWCAIFRGAYDGFSGKQIVLDPGQSVDLSGILQNGRR